MKIINKLIEKQTKEELEFIDLTDEIDNFVKESRIENGFINIQTLHTTAPLLLNENEPLLLEDFKKHLRNLSPKESEYNHNDFHRRTVNICDNECVNGHSHCQALHLPSGITINVISGKLQLGQWQRIFLVELDRSKQRKVQLQIMGE
ncbi:MAG: secondary thiamine-phosphate synthase enzyme YjbQ [Candidatus Nealsonbacteria bacterium]